MSSSPLQADRGDLLTAVCFSAEVGSRFATSMLLELWGGRVCSASHAKTQAELRRAASPCSRDFCGSMVEVVAL